MIKRSLYFGNPAYLSIQNEQLIIRLPDEGNELALPEEFNYQIQRSIPVEDIGVLVIDNKQVTITQSVFEKLLENNAAVICCDSTHHPAGLLLPLSVNTVQSERFRQQISASIPLKKQLWQQTVVAKIRNQAAVLCMRGVAVENMYHWADSVSSGDSRNHEARAAAYYWQQLFADVEGFTRDRSGIPPNNLLNYGYAILRAVVARALVSSGLLPVFGIHHHNRYNAYCLADDIMEPFRPYVDLLVRKIVDETPYYFELNKELKTRLLSIPVMDITIDGKSSPLMVGVSQTTASLNRCFEGNSRKIVYPVL